MKQWRHKILLLLALLVAETGLTPLPAFAQHPRDVSGLLRRLDKELQTAEKALAVVPNPALKAELEQARRLRAEAAAAFQQKQYRVADAKAKQALRLLDEIRAKLLRGPVQKLVQRYQDLLRQAELLVPGSGDKEAERLLNDAKKSARQAKALASRGLFEKSAARYREAIFLLQTCLKKVKKGTRVQDHVKAARQRLQTLRDRVRSAPQKWSQDPRAQTLVQQAQEEALRGEKAEGAGRWRAALEHYNRATRLLYRLLDQAGPPAERTLQELDQLMRSRRDAVPRDRAGRLLWQRIERLRNDAWQALQGGRPALATKKALLARRLLESTRSTGGMQGQARTSTVRRELERYRAAVQRLRRQVAENDHTGRQLLREAARQGRLAQRLLEKGRPRLASQHLLVGYRLLEVARSSAPPDQGTATELQRKITQLKSRLQGSVKFRGDKPFTRTAAHLLEQASKALEGGNLQAAARLVAAAESLLEASGSGQ